MPLSVPPDVLPGSPRSLPTSQGVASLNTLKPRLATPRPTTSSGWYGPAAADATGSLALRVHHRSPPRLTRSMIASMRRLASDRSVMAW